MFGGADACDVEIDNAYQSRAFDSCKVKLITGQVTMEVEGALDQEDKAAGIILACPTKATEAVMIAT